MNGSLDWMREELARLESSSLRRELSPASPQQGGWIAKDGRTMLNLASNDYLGLAAKRGAGATDGDPRESADDPGDGGARFGAGASRLVSGNDPAMAAFERDFAAFKGTESCLLFGSGYMANVGIIPALVGRGDIVFSDKLNHASIVDGIVLSRADHMRYRHNDTAHLERMLRQAEPGRKKLIVTDAVFSMDGDVAPLRELVRLKNEYGAMLMVDEAHSGGIFGERGEGLVHALGLAGHVDVQMGTFSKAYGCYGAYAAGERLLTDYLVNKARSFIYSTALPPAVVQAIAANWRTAKEEGWRRETVLRHAETFRSALRRAGFDTGLSECQIVPVVVGDNARTVAFSRMLQAEGIAAVAIRPPTVPDGTARIRFSVMATHRPEDLAWAADTIAACGRQLGIVPPQADEGGER